MHRQLTSRTDRRARDEHGAVAVITAISMTVLLVMAAMVLDFGLVRVDRQVDKAAADSATLAGLHGLNKGSDGNAYPFNGVCTALRYLSANGARFAGATDTSGTWTDGAGAAKSNGCTTASLTGATCTPGSTSSWAKYSWSGTFQGTAISLTIQSGYSLPDATSWPEDNLPAAQSFQSDSAQGCNQLAVIITQKRKPGLGSLAVGSNQLTSSIRTVGRVKLKAGDAAPAMLLLRRTGCPVLQSATGGNSHVYLYGGISSDLRTQAGTIHADTSGNGCTGGSNQNVFLGRRTSGIVAFAAPLSTNPTLPDSTKPGQISSVAGLTNAPTSGIVSDGLTNVLGSSALNEAGIAAAAKSSPGGRGQVTRKPIDDRYLYNPSGTGVTGIVSTSTAKWSLTAANASLAANGSYTVVNSCSPAAGSVGSTVTKVFVNCTANNGFTGPFTFPSSVDEVVFNGSVKPSGLVSIPNATKVYIFGDPTKDAIALSTGNTFSVHTTSGPSGAISNISGGQCTSTTRGSTNKAIVVTKAGDMKQGGGTLQLCNTTVVQLGNVADGCLSQVPSQEASGPSATPCTGSSGGLGDGQLSQSGGNIDWTAPNSLDITTDLGGNALATAMAGWGDPAGPEDLAFWSESATNSSLTYNMGGTGTLHVQGVYMAPNAEPFTIGGGAVQTLINAQYVASSIALNGGAEISMKVDPNSAVTLPDLGYVGLVR